MFYWVNLNLILLDATNAQIKIYAAVVTRKLLEIKESEISSTAWKDCDDSIKEQVKHNVLRALISVNDRSLKYKICDTVITICENVYENEETWQDLLNYIFGALNAQLSEENILYIESGLYLLSSIFGYVYDELSKAVSLYVTSFQNFFRSNSLPLKTRTVQAIAEIMSIVHKRDVKKFKDFVLNILQTTMECVQNPKEENNVNLFSKFSAKSLFECLG